MWRMRGGHQGQRQETRQGAAAKTLEEREVAWAGSGQRSQPGAFDPERHLATSGTQWVEPKGAAEHPTMHGTAPTTKDHTA